MFICWMNCLQRMCLEMTPSWFRQVNWGNCKIPLMNCAVLCVKDDSKGDFWGLRCYLSKLRSLLSFSPSGMTSNSKIGQFNWECTAPRYILAPLFNDIFCCLLNHLTFFLTQAKYCVSNESILCIIWSWIETSTLKLLTAIALINWSLVLALDSTGY